MKPPVALVRAYAYFLQLPLNERKRKNPPEHPITVYNRWWWGVKTLRLGASDDRIRNGLI